MNGFKHSILVILIAIVIVAIVTFLVVSALDCHPDATGWGLWFFAFLGGFILLGL